MDEVSLYASEVASYTDQVVRLITSVKVAQEAVADRHRYLTTRSVEDIQAHPKDINEKRAFNPKLVPVPWGMGTNYHPCLFIMMFVAIFCIFVIVLWFHMIFTKHGTRQRYLRWCAAQERKNREEERVFRHIHAQMAE